MYDTPYDRFGMLTFQMWRAARLVVDTGIHHKGWTREQAINYPARQHRARRPRHRDRGRPLHLLARPGAELLSGRDGDPRRRARAEKALGPKFDIRAFHDTVLSIGSVPLPVLEQQLEGYIASGGKDPIAPNTGATVHHFP